MNYLAEDGVSGIIAQRVNVFYTGSLATDNVFYQELAKRSGNRLLSVNFRVSFIFFEGFRPDEVENEA